jgi:hypothetical protein
MLDSTVSPDKKGTKVAAKKTKPVAKKEESPYKKRSVTTLTSY